MQNYILHTQNNSASIYHYSQSPTGNCSTACRKTGSTLVYTLFVRFGEECSNSFCVTAVDMSWHVVQVPRHCISALSAPSTVD